MGYATYTKMGDIYSLFYELGSNLMKSNGFLCFITSNKWMRADYGSVTRKYLSTHTSPLEVIDFGMKMVFDNATVYSCILLMTNKNNDLVPKAVRTPNDFDFNVNFETYFRDHCVSFIPNENEWVIQDKDITLVKYKIENQGIKLSEWDIKINRGILTGLNEAFIINAEKRKELLELDPNNAEIIQPILRGQDIKAWKVSFENLFVISTFPSRNIDIEIYPSVKNHLLSFGMKKLAQSGEVGFKKKDKQ